MAPKPKPSTQPQPSHSAPRRITGSPNGLGPYIVHPETFPSSTVVTHSPDFVVVNDLYPKSSIHVLLLPRSRPHTLQHPFDAFQDAAFLASVQAEIARVKALVAKELQRRFGAGSAKDANRRAVLDGDAEPQEDGELPAGRNWEAEVMSGVHARPSMNHLHIHVLSREMHSPRLRHRKHYNSFNTPFLVDVADFPLEASDPRLHPGREQYLNRDLACWRCGQNFKNRFKALKEHLEVEFEAWRRE